MGHSKPCLRPRVKRHGSSPVLAQNMEPVNSKLRESNSDGVCNCPIRLDCTDHTFFSYWRRESTPAP
ncbi:hypothetical protein M0657_003454 [Pyricularia oryzae]|nr:hypothetical protein M9X92_006143 [Pyricularia oryzae]KAI7926877.1 hypothetical protein M0657_003454 [Pyricularia oryzae]